MSDLRLFSYLPNPRAWKATIAARLAGVEVELRGDSPRALERWLWDFDARPLAEGEEAAGAVRVGDTGGYAGATLHKTEAFLDANPFGTAPAAFSPDGKTGIFESNSILRAVARLGEARVPLYGRDAYEASRIDAFLDASLVFGRDTQAYLVGLLRSTIPADAHARAKDAVAIYLAGIDRALAHGGEFLVGDRLSIADVGFACEVTMLWYGKPRAKDLEALGLEPLLPSPATHPRACAHFERLRAHPAFAVDLEPHLAKLEQGKGLLSV